MQLMARSQSLAVPIWKLKLWWPKIKKRLENAARGDPVAFPKLENVKHTLKPGGKFKDVTLLQGWLRKGCQGRKIYLENAKSSDIKADREEFAKSLCEELQK